MISEAEALARYPGAVSFTFGDSAALNAEVLALVLAGRKTVTCDALAAFAARGETLPEAGRVDIALTWDGDAASALRTVDVSRMAFEEIDAETVADMGEFEDLAAFRRGYGAYLTRAGFFTPDVEMLVERFEVVERF